MGHFAIVDIKTNLVREVIVVPNEKMQSLVKETRLINIAGIGSKENLQMREVLALVDDEKKGIDFLNKFYNNPEDVYFVQTSYSGSFRKNFAGKGNDETLPYRYDKEKDAFIAPKPTVPMFVKNEKGEYVEDSGEWILNEEICRWEWISASTNTQSMFRRMANTVVESSTKITNIVTPKQKAMAEKYKGSYLMFLFKDSYNWAGVLVGLIFYLWSAIGSDFAAGSYFFLAVELVVIFMTILHYRQRKRGKTS